MNEEIIEDYRYDLLTEDGKKWVDCMAYEIDKMIGQYHCSYEEVYMFIHRLEF